MFTSNNGSALFGAACLIVCSATLGACDPSVGRAIAHAESFNFSYQRLQPDPAQQGKYALKMNLGSGCKNYFFSASELADALRTKQFQLTHIIGGRPTTVTASLTFDAISECDTARQEVRYETLQLSEEFTDANGNKARRRPKDQIGLPLVTAEFSTAGGVMEVSVENIKLIGNTVSRTGAPGPLAFTTIEVPAAKVGGGSGVYVALNLNPQFVEAKLSSVLANPDRFAAEFAFLAKTDPASNEILLVWDGGLVLRTDIEN